tara:strand:+ start:119 stop:1159 length:1041 start_codon:yes stop_codon:yes gene_type:complete
LRVLVTGGAGFIGSHICIELLSAGHNVIVVDNLENSSEKIVLTVSRILNIELNKDINSEARFSFFDFDIGNSAKLKELFQSNYIDAMIHCAGLKSPEESINYPLKYAENNISGSIVLFKEAIKSNVKNIIFSSSASVYGVPQEIPIKEESLPRNLSNPYARTKLTIEDLLFDLQVVNPELSVICLRYFNPVGCHRSGLLGESPKNLATNLMPRINDVVLGKQQKLNIYGNDYQTRDGTGIRDFIHVVDLARGHLAALNFILDEKNNFDIFNLGRGKGTTVLELVAAYEEASGQSIPIKFSERREGDVPESWASVNKAKELLNWKSEYSLSRICEDNWRWLNASRII